MPSNVAGHEPIAVIGVGCRLPGGVDTPGAMWRLLAAGRDTVSEVPADRWQAEDLVGLKPDVIRRMRWGSFLDGDIGAFDPEAFGLNNREAPWVDPQHRLLLAVTWEALEHAGVPVGGVAGSRTGVFVGISQIDYAMRAHRSLEQTEMYAGIGGIHSVGVNRLSFLLDLHGPSLAVDTACSSSLVATHLACESLRRGESNMALAGGVSATLSPEFSFTCASWEMLSTSGHCHPFDADADGYVRAEGCVVVVLKRLSDARRDGDRILALLRGTAVNQDGRSTRITAPNPEAQREVYRAALADAEVDPNLVGMVEAHGTGTPVGDPVEFDSLSSVYGQGKSPCALGSVKSNIGHTEAASGLSGLLKAVLCVGAGRIPPTLQFRRWNPQIDPSRARFFVPTRLEPWPVAEGPRLAAVSSYGVGGTNAHVIVEQAPASHPPDAASPADDGLHTVLLSAKSGPALDAAADRLADWLEDEGRSTALHDVAHTLATRRSHARHRLAVVAESHEELVGRLRAGARREVVPGVTTGTSRDAAARGAVWVFSGHGFQWPGMCQRLLDDDPAFTAAIDALEPMVAAEGGFSLREALTRPDTATGIAHVQPLLFAVQMGLAAMLRAQGVRPAAVIGHSLGEIAAAVTAGALTPEDGVRVVCRRARLLAGVVGGAMASVDLGWDEVAQDLAASGVVGVEPAVMASPKSTVVAGDREQLERLVSDWEARDVTARMVAVDVAAHSPFMDPILDDLTAALTGLDPRAPTVPLYSTVSEDPRAAEARNAAYWRANQREPVRFWSALTAAADDGHRLFLEVSAHPLLVRPVLQTLAHAGHTDAVVLPTLLRNRDDRLTFRTQLAALHCAGHPVDWARQYRTGDLVDVPPTTWERNHHLVPPNPLVKRDDTHPLLGAYVHSRDGGDWHLWQALLDEATLPWLPDHRVEDTVVLPGAALCDMAVASAARVFATGATSVQVRNVDFEHTLSLDSPVEVTTTAADDGTGLVRWEVSSYLEGGERIRYVTAELTRSSSAEQPERVDLDTLLASHPVHRPPGDFYGTSGAVVRGVFLGPAIAGIRDLRLREGDSPGVVAEIGIPDAGLAGARFAHWHPVLLDNCFQAVAALWLASFDVADGPLLPVDIASITIHRSTAQGRFCHAWLTHADGESATADFRLLDEDGLPLADVHGVRLVRGAANAQQAFDTRLLQVCWEPEPLPVSAATDRGSWLVVSPGTDAWADTLGAALSSALGHKAVTVTDARASGTDFSGHRAIVVCASPEHAPGDESPVEAATRQMHTIMPLLQQVCATGDAAPPRLWLLTRGAQLVRPDDPVSLAQGGLHGMMRALTYEHSELRPSTVDVGPGTPIEDVVAELLTDGAADQVAYRDRTRYLARLRPAPLRDDERKTVLCRFDQDPAALDLRRSGDLDSLELVHTPRRDPAPGEIHIQVRASGLNFADVLIAMGQYHSVDGVPPALGFDCAGTVAAVGESVHDIQVGDRVAALLPGAGLASSVVVRADWAMKLPEGTDFEEAAALPLAYVTAWYSLRDLARLAPGERVLIHSATGGVGLAAVNIAQARGAEIFATAGTAEKRAYLRELGIAHVMDSRSLDFAVQVREATAGRGVDIVLNSLAGPAQAAGLELLAPGGRFVEIGKRDIYADATLGLHPFRHSIALHSLDVMVLMTEKPELIAGVINELHEAWTDGNLPPLPTTTLPIGDAVTALRTMANAEHRGKTVLTWPAGQRAAAVVKPEDVPLVRADGSYIITGGLGGLGLLTARWLAERGAGAVILNGRSAPSPYAEEAIKTIRAGGTTVEVVRGDIAEPGTAERVAAAACARHPLRGVVHSAGVLDDATFLRVDADRLRRQWRPKTEGTWRLHQATLSHEVDWWVAFSSIASLFSGAGEAGYAAASGWMDAFIDWRRQQALPATGFHWGAWAEYGLAAGMDVFGDGMIRPEEGIAALERLLAYDRPHPAYSHVNLADWLKPYPATAAVPFFAGVLGSSAETAADESILVALRDAEHPEQRRALLDAHITQQILTVLQMQSQSLDKDTPLASVGLDSLAAMELRARLQNSLGVSIPRTILWARPTIAALGDELTKMLAQHPDT
nr:type I polyketide synthase [Streptomyces regalis]